jgi:hypothetical protein
MNSNFICKNIKMKVSKNDNTIAVTGRNKLFTGVFMLLYASTLISQKAEKLPCHLGIGIGTHVSGNAHGGVYDIYGSIYNGNSILSIGPCIQKRSNSICGARMAFSYMITGRDDFSNPGNRFNESEKLQLYFFSYLQYIYKAPLSFASVKREEIVSRKNDNREVDFNKYKFSTTEAGLGFGLNIKLGKQLVWSNYIGFSTYYHTNYVEGMYAERIAPVLIMGTSLGVKLF